MLKPDSEIAISIYKASVLSNTIQSAIIMDALAQTLVAMSIILLIFYSIITEGKQKRNSNVTLGNLKSISPRKFEKTVKRLYSNKGYRTKMTKKGSDDGLDVIARNPGEKIGIQAKRYSTGNKVGAPTVRNTIGAAAQQGCDKAVVVTTSTFTSPAKKTARQSRRKGTEVELIGGKKLVRQLRQHTNHSAQG